MKRRSVVIQIFDPVLTANVSATSVRKFVYLLIANKPFRCGNDYTRIVYIGMTGVGLHRLAGSVSWRIQESVEKRIVSGLRRIDGYVVWAKNTKPNVLECALLIRFCKKHGVTPPLNRTGHKMKEGKVFNELREETIDRIINRYL
jgi:hypothetical protein